MELEIGLMIKAGPIIDFLETETLSTKGCNYCLIHNANEVSYYSLTRVPLLGSGLASVPRLFKFRSTSSLAVSTLAKESPSYVFNSLKST
jgi:hypothetical protein